jgi:hypothetical protein
MNRIILHAVIAAVPLSIALCAPSHAQYAAEIPELSRSSVSPIVQVADKDIAQQHFTAISGDQQTLDKMSESSTVRVVCGVAVATPVLTMSAPGQTIDQKLYVVGLSAALVGGFLLAVASIFTLRWKTFAWRASRAAALWGVSGLTMVWPLSDYLPHTAVTLLNILFPFVVAGILAPKSIWSSGKKLKSSLTGAMPLPLFAAMAAICCSIFAWATQQQDSLTPLRKIQAPSEIGTTKSPVSPPVKPLVTPPML